MQLRIDNISKDVEKLGYNSGVNFGRFKNKDTIVTYQLSVSKSQFLAILTKPYEQTKIAVKADDLKYKETSDFSEVNYCSLQELLEKPTILTSIFDTYLRDDFFDAIIDFENDHKYYINSIDAIVSDKNIVITGKAYTKK